MSLSACRDHWGAGGAASDTSGPERVDLALQGGEIRGETGLRCVRCVEHRVCVREPLLGLEGAGARALREGFIAARGRHFEVLMMDNRGSLREYPNSP